MNRIKIKYIPSSVAVFLGILAVLICILSDFSDYIKDSVPLAIKLIIGITFIVLLIMVIVVNTKVTFGEGSIIECKWQFLKWKIDIEKYHSVMYTLKYNSIHRKGHEYSFEIIFYGDKEKPFSEKRLKTLLDHNTAERCIQHRYDDAELMQVYRYIENNYPEKAKGYI